MRVQVYYNLHKKALSVISRDPSIYKYGLLWHHRKAVELTDVSFCVREKGRQKVIRQKKKNVHAYVKGDYSEDHMYSFGCGVKDTNDRIITKCELENKLNPGKFSIVTYDPYKFDSFVLLNDTSKKVIAAEKVFIIDKVIYAKNPVFGD